MYNIDRRVIETDCPCILQLNWGQHVTLSPRHSASYGCGLKRRHPDMQRNCEYIELAVAVSWKGQSLRLGCGRGANNFSP